MKTTTAKEDQAFLSALNLENALEIAGEHIAENFTPGEIFEYNQLVEWAIENGFSEQENKA